MSGDAFWVGDVVFSKSMKMKGTMYNSNMEKKIRISSGHIRIEKTNRLQLLAKCVHHHHYQMSAPDFYVRLKTKKITPFAEHAHVFHANPTGGSTSMRPVFHVDWLLGIVFNRQILHIKDPCRLTGASGCCRWLPQRPCMYAFLYTC